MTASVETAHAARLHANKLARKLAKPHGNYDHSEHQWGYVQAIHTDPPTVDLYLDGTQNVGVGAYLTKGVKYLASYTPAVGDVVVVYRGRDRNRSSRVVLGKLGGAASPYPLPLGATNGAGQYVSGPNAIWGGSGAPSGTLGSSGDWYLETSAALLYKNQGGSWSIVAAPTVPSFFTPAHPTPITGTSLEMCGLALSFTPQATGNLLLVVAAAAGTDTGAVGFSLGARYGTGTAPANGAAVTGTAIGDDRAYAATSAAGTYGAVAKVGTATGLTVGTAYWFDLCASTSNAADAVEVRQIEFLIWETV